MALRHHRQTTTNLLNQMTCFIAWAAALLLLPVIVLLWLTESRTTRIKRMRNNGWTWDRIGKHYGVHRTTARRWCPS
jgi:hypothetical protein